MHKKPPFLFLNDIISPLTCEDIAASYEYDLPDVNKKTSKPIKTVRYNRLMESRIVHGVIKPILPIIENHFNVQYKGLLPMSIEWYPENCEEIPAESESEKLIRNKWVKVNDSDFTVIIPLKDYYDPSFDEDMDPSYEVYGGSLQFVNFNFTLNTRRGSAIIFPTTKNFAFNVKPPKIADQFLLKFNIVCEKPFKYMADEYEANYTRWNLE